MSTFDLRGFSDAVADVVADAESALASLPHGSLTASAFHWRNGIYVAPQEVVAEAEEIVLTLSSGKTVTGEMVGRDGSTGVALIRANTDAVAVTLNRATKPRPGAVAITLGSSKGTTLASFGSVAAVGPAWRTLRGAEIAYRVALAINVGALFHGGAVLDADGALVGMMLFGAKRQSFVMPHEAIEGTVRSIETKGHVARGYLGASLHPLKQDNKIRGAVVMALDANGPAKAAGLQLGDIVVAWDGEAVKGPHELVRLLGPNSAGKSVVFGIVRGGQARQITVALGERPLV